MHTKRGWVVVASDTTHYYENMMTGRPFTTAFHIGLMLEAYDTLRAEAPTPQHIVPGHDPKVMQFYPPPSPELAGIVVRLDVTPDDAELAKIRSGGDASSRTPPKAAIRVHNYDARYRGLMSPELAGQSSQAN